MSQSGYPHTPVTRLRGAGSGSPAPAHTGSDSASATSTYVVCGATQGALR